MTRYALVGAGSRATMYLDALAGTWYAGNELVALCDTSFARMAWHNRRRAQRYGRPPTRAWHADDFGLLLAQARPQTVIVSTVDAAHHDYVIRALDAGCDVICEKPMTIDESKARAILEAVERNGCRLRVAFNYRYAPANTRMHELLRAGTIGRPLHVDFSWLLDTRHGADYFRRWHREKSNSGGLLVHKATHHFDLVNWWLGARPQSIFAIGGLMFYGEENARARGEHHTYARYSGEPSARADPFALDLDADPALRGLYRYAEAESGYLRDRNVFGAPVTIEDTLCVCGRWRNGALLSYSLVAYAPWEGFRVAITGTRGRLELEVVESVFAGRDPGASKGAHKSTTLRVCPQFAAPWLAEIPAAGGGHGGADPLLLEQLFAPEPPPDPHCRAASQLDGAASILVGIAANHSLESGQPVDVDSLLQLPV